MNVIKGNLIKLAKEGRFNVIAHGCNCFCTMGAGIALQIKNEFPEAYRADCTTRPGDFNKLGNFSTCRVNTTSLLWVYNLYTQYKYDSQYKPFDYEAFILCLRKMKYDIEDNPLVSKIGIPLIGYGLAGGDLSKIVRIMYDALGNIDYTIVIFDRDPKADELVNFIQTYFNTRS